MQTQEPAASATKDIDRTMQEQQKLSLEKSKAPQHVWEWSGDYTQSAFYDISHALRYWPLWGRLGWQDVMLRYRRSIIGPLWLTISMGVTIFALGYIYGGLFNIDVEHYLPFLTAGFLVWGLLTSTINEGCQTYIETDWIIRQIDLPLSMFPLRVVWRNLIIFSHNTLIYILVAWIFNLNVGWSLLLVIPGLMLLLLNAVWFATLLGMLSARFRDLPQIISSILQVAFFITPIIWTPEQAEHRPLLVVSNPFYHFIELLRAPMLGKTPTLLNWEVALLITAAGWLLTFVFYRRFHGRIAYWV
jgi:ABC-type polysaccharide/polyol phosphate export permease